jgi:hypothetical protein
MPIKRICGLVIVFLVIAPLVQAALGEPLLAYAKKPSQGFSRLHTEGRWIKDNDGTVVTLRGAAVFRRWMWAEAWKNFDPLNYIDENQQKYDVYAASGANFLRVQLNKWLWDNANPTYTRAIDTLVSWCRQRGIMVVLAFQDDEPYDYEKNVYYKWTNEEQVDYIVNGTMQTFMGTLASRYKTQLNVIGFEIMAERPRDTFWAAYRGVTLEQARSEYRHGLISAIRAIHSVDPSYLVFVYPASDDELYKFVVEAPIAEPNVVYCQMRSVSWDRGWRAYADAYYNGDPAAYARMEQDYQSLLFNVVDLGYPVILMETEAKDDLANAPGFVNDLFVLFRQHQTSICWWAFERQPLFHYLALLKDTQSAKSVLTETGLAWAQQMKQ